MNEDLSRHVADLRAQAKRGEDLSSGISRVRAAIKKVIEGGDTIFATFNALVESLREMIPEEKQRYQAAIKALAATSKLSRNEILAAVNKHLEELKILEKVLVFTHPRPDELKAMEARSQKIKNEISRLREEIAQLEKEEKEVADSIAEQGKETAVIEKALREVFTDIRAEITSVREKLEEPRVESAAQQPIPDTQIAADLAVKEQSDRQTGITGHLSSHNDTKPQKTCPLCGGRMDYYLAEKKWQCFSCAYEELEKDEVQRKSREPGADILFPEPAPASEPKKKCRMCGGRMDYYLAEKKWQCFSCAFEEPEQDEVQRKNGELSTDAIFPEPTPASSLKQDGEKGEQGTPEPAPGPELKQTCSMCGGRMDYYAADRKWQCYSCGFEYTKNEIQGKSEEKQDHSNTLLAMPAAESLFDQSSTARSSPGSPGPKKEPALSKKQPAITKTCPACGKKMRSSASGTDWQCRYCGYERRL